jgi:hypothetical protein
VLPVSVSEAAAADDEAVALADEDEDEELPELPQAAASTVSGTRAGRRAYQADSFGHREILLCFLHVEACVLQLARGVRAMS